MLFFRYQPPGILNFAMLRRGELFFASPSELNDAHECRPQLILNGSKELWQRLADYVLLDLVIAAESHENIDRTTSESVLRLADPIGAQLKQRLRSKDVEVERLGPIFAEVAKSFFSDLFDQQTLEAISRWLNSYFAEALPARLLESNYVACFSLNATNPTMWGHYAKAERGFVIVYATQNGAIHVRSPLKLLYGIRPLEKEGPGVWEAGIYDEEHLELRSVIYRKHPPKINA